ncbi:MAG TPA: ABC transporter permease subunit [Casimicrobiaceae bacterium]|nr:ABC transporter permease subunit [Casimicrobiaceae bacterium]
MATVESASSAALAPPRPPLNLRSIGLQALALALVVALGAWLVNNATINLRAQNIASGFGFLGDTAGFAISEGLLPYEPSDSYARAFAAGVANTLRAALPAVVLATVLGFALGIAQTSRHALVRLLSRGFVDLVRNVPLLVQVLLWYFALTELLPGTDTPLRLSDVAFLSKGGLNIAMPELTASQAIVPLALTILVPWLAWLASPWRRITLPVALLVVVGVWLLWPDSWQHPEVGNFGVSGGATLTPEWLALVIALTQYSGAYCAEIVRAGLQAVPRGQWEATHALGLTRPQALRRVIVPQSLRVIVPPYTSLVMNTIKNSSLAVAIGYPDIVSAATTALNQNGQAIECISIIAAVYLLLNLLTTLVMGVVNARVQLKER